MAENVVLPIVDGTNFMLRYALACLGTMESGLASPFRSVADSRVELIFRHSGRKALKPNPITVRSSELRISMMYYQDIVKLRYEIYQSLNSLFAST